VRRIRCRLRLDPIHFPTNFPPSERWPRSVRPQSTGAPDESTGRRVSWVRVSLLSTSREDTQLISTAQLPWHFHPCHPLICGQEFFQGWIRELLHRVNLLAFTNRSVLLPTEIMSIVGTVESLWRYPVKSMRGEELNELFAGYAGVYGDRLFAFKSP